MNTVNWLHLSDWHQKGQDFDREVVRDMLIEDVRARDTIDPELARIDFIIFSGDLANSGKEAEYDAARQYFLDPILKVTGLDARQFFIVPGNHDIDTSRFHRLPSDLKLPLKDTASVNAWLNDENDRHLIMEHFEAFKQFVGSYTGQHSPEYASTRMVTVNGKQIALIGLNSAWMCGRDLTTKDFDYGKTLLGEHQIHKPLVDIKAADIKIAVLHHPFDWLVSFDRDVVERRLYQSMNFILYGHNHKSNVQVTHSNYGDCILIPGGACYERRIADNPRYTNSYNYVTVNLDTGESSVYFRRWSEGRTAWIKDEDSIADGHFKFNIPHLRSVGVIVPKDEKPLDELIPSYKNLAPPKINNPPLIGRNALVSEIKEFLSQKTDCTLWGAKGIGKSSIARELAHNTDLKKVFSNGVLWITLGSTPEVATVFGKWAKELGIATIGEVSKIEEQKEAIHQVLSQRSMLLVIDGVEQIEDLKAVLQLNNDEWLGGLSCARLITTANQKVAQCLGAKGLKCIEGISKEDAFKLFDQIDSRVRQRADGLVDDFVSSSKIARWPSVIREVANAFALQIAMETDNLAYDEIKRIIENKKELLNLAGKNDQQSLKNLIQSNIKSLEPSQSATLKLLSIFPIYPNSFDLDAVKAICGCNTEEKKNMLRRDISRLVKFSFLEMLTKDGVVRYAISDIVKAVCDSQEKNEETVKNFVSYFLDYTYKNRCLEENIERERENILEALTLAKQRDMNEVFLSGVKALGHFTEKRGLCNVFKDYLFKADGIAAELRDHEGRAEILRYLGNSSFFLRKYEDAQQYYESAAKVMPKQVNNSHVLLGIYIGLAKVAFKQGRFADVTKLYETAIGIVNGDNEALIDLYALMGETEDICGNYPKSDAIFEKGIRIADAIKDNERRCCLLAHRGWVSAHQGYFNQARSYWLCGSELADNGKIYPELVFLYANLGWLYDRNGDYQNADTYFDKGLILARKTGYLYGISVLQTNKGAALLHRGLYDEAERCLNESREIEDGSRDIERMGVTQENLGILESKRGNFLLAIKYFENGLDCAQKGVRERICATKTFLGDIYQNLATMEKDPQTKQDYISHAEECFQEAKGLANALRNPERKANVYKHYGIFLDRLGKHQEAEDYLKRALSEALIIGYQWLISSIYNALGNHYLARQLLPAANKQFHDALTIADKIDSRDMKAAALYGLARCPRTVVESRKQRENAEKSGLLYKEMGHYKLVDVDNWLSSCPSEIDFFDVFLSHNSIDKPIVRELANVLKIRNLRPWLDEVDLKPGVAWLDEVEKIIRTTSAAAVLIGNSGLGPWEIPEMRACLEECVTRALPVIPVLLPGAPEKPELPLFLRGFTWIDLRNGLTEENIGKLVWGITGIRPEQLPQHQ
ncbi:MAG: tetratricopeptide repeat protein [Methylobacter sp.]